MHEILEKAALRASERLQVDLSGIHDPKDLVELSLLLDRLNGGDLVNIRHFMRTRNRLTGGIPVDQVNSGEIRAVLDTLERIEHGF